MTENINIYIRWGLVNISGQGFILGTCTFFSSGMHGIIPGTCDFCSSGIAFCGTCAIAGICKRSTLNIARCYCWDQGFRGDMATVGIANTFQAGDCMLLLLGFELGDCRPFRAGIARCRCWDL
jgi:hypothetical protein